MSNEQQIEAAAKVLSAEGAWCGDCDEPDYERCPECRQSCQILARAALAAAHPTITTAEDLEALPVGALIRCSDRDPGTPYLAPGDLWEKYDDDHWGLMRDMPISSRTKNIPLPATVLHFGNTPSI